MSEASQITMLHENEILMRINEISNSLVEERVRNEERSKNMLEKIERALSHAHDARNIANAVSIRIELLEKDLMRIDFEQKSKKKVSSNFIVNVLQTTTAMIFGGMLIFIWESIKNK